MAWASARGRQPEPAAVSEAQIRVLGRLVSDVVKVHALCKVVLIEELRDLSALDETISGLRTRRDEIRPILETRTPPAPASLDEGSGSEQRHETNERPLA